MTDECTQLSAGEADALRVRRLELDLGDLRAENARLNATMAQQHSDILRLNEAEKALLVELSAHPTS